MFQLTDSLLRGVMHHRPQFPLELCHPDPPVFGPRKLALTFPTPESDTTSVASTPSETSTVCSPVLRQRMSLSFITNPSSNESGLEDEQAPPQADVMCSKKNCYRTANSLFGAFCEFHKPSRLCKVPQCRKCAKTGGFCISHGGGRRCRNEGCIKSAKEGGYCIAHGGGKRCREEGCSNWCDSQVNKQLVESPSRMPRMSRTGLQPIAPVDPVRTSSHRMLADPVLGSTR
ncbi:hypothetical protein BBO99_00008465 [Phytophthora kernoviae]|uniref:WRKY19-like zinc finger domain-containing protein n=2 Tax=Phytophthora kernoviae TaxID=325452 RepID=A0A3R7JVK6_9STRA|nr:hypothetical protein G195_009804 [Phytophthora kernoviae 00238/432]KAG2515370.1 hypothetical protein JM18_008105 [Phytophthora kernoviae]KAG2526467.1 hypothetical protein JM16_002854 [Phytophthora kernoviae]RLN02849.1 hypothetical protein BBI17_008376 [Phytophthora kernoviae]RLN75261.1 hypothetical protein BBO99_00008465 [Phytophthora kernoviae]